MEKSDRCDVADRLTSVRQWQSTLDTETSYGDKGMACRLLEACTDVMQSYIQLLKQSRSVESCTLRKACDLLGSLQIWMGDVGARTGHLDHVLDSSDRLKTLTLSGIADIARLLQRLPDLVGTEDMRCQQDLISKRVTLWRNLADADQLVADSDEADSEYASDIECTSPHGGEVSLVIAIDDLQEELRVLENLDIALHKSASTRFEAQSTATIPTADQLKPSHHFEDRISSRFPFADNAIICCLGKANLQRYLRGEALRSQESNSSTDFSSVIKKSRHASTVNDSALGSSLVTNPKYASTIATAMSFHGHHGHHVKYPPRPTEVSEQGLFRCPCCARMIRAANNSAWKRHIIVTLQPFTCFLGHCADDERTFPDRNLWAQHLAHHHHITSSIQSLSCPLCIDKICGGPGAILNHLSDHLEEISLSALPLSMYNTGDDIANRDDDSSVTSTRSFAYSEFEIQTQTSEKTTTEQINSEPSDTVADAKQIRDAMNAKEAADKAFEDMKKKYEESERARNIAEAEAFALKLKDIPPPIKFNDAVGRKFTFPFDICKTWKDMESLIKQAFLHVELVGPHVMEGHYDLIGPDDNIILPQVWDVMIKPGDSIGMQMWPMPELMEMQSRGQAQMDRSTADIQTGTVDAVQADETGEYDEDGVGAW